MMLTDVLFVLFDEPPTFVESLTQNLHNNEFLWRFLPIGYLFTIAIETTLLLIGLSPKITLKQKLACGVWLTACTYPIVVLVLPNLITSSQFLYLLIAETFAPLAEYILFWIIFRGKPELTSNDWIRCFVAITLANLASFGIGEILNSYRWFGLF